VTPLSQHSDAKSQRLARRIMRMVKAGADTSYVPDTVVEPIARAMCKSAGVDPDEPIAEGAYPRWYGMGNEARSAFLASLEALTNVPSI